MIEERRKGGRAEGSGMNGDRRGKVIILCEVKNEERKKKRKGGKSLFVEYGEGEREKDRKREREKEGERGGEGCWYATEGKERNKQR